MRGRLATLLLIAAAALPAAAQPAPPASAPSTLPGPAPEPAPDPARLAAAQRLAPLVMPPEQIRRMLGGGLPMMDAAMDLTAAEVGLGEETGLSESDRQRPLGEIAAQRDPHFRERVAIRNRIMSETMGDVFVAAMPDLHRVMAEIYALRFSLDELNAAIAYFSTPAGRRFIEVSMNLGQDPAFVRGIVALTPRFMEAFSTMEERIRVASAHLPPEPAPAPGAEPAED